MYGLRIANLRISCTGQGDKGLALIRVSEGHVSDTQLHGKFRVGLYATILTITNIERCVFVENQIGLQLDHTTNAAINISGCNFWDNPIAHIKIGNVVGLNIFNNWLEYSDTAIWADNSLPETIWTKVRIYNNNFSTGDPVKYPNSKTLGVQATDTSGTNMLAIYYSTFENNFCFNKKSDYVIDFKLLGAKSNGTVYMRVAGNCLWGGQQAAIRTDSPNVSLDLSNNDPRAGWFEPTVAETEGNGKFAG